MISKISQKKKLEKNCFLFYSTKNKKIRYMYRNILIIIFVNITMFFFCFFFLFFFATDLKLLTLLCFLIIYIYKVKNCQKKWLIFYTAFSYTPFPPPPPLLPLHSPPFPFNSPSLPGGCIIDV